jgi:Tol biopolymer transport system component
MIPDLLRKQRDLLFSLIRSANEPLTGSQKEFQGMKQKLPIFFALTLSAVISLLFTASSAMAQSLTLASTNQDGSNLCHQGAVMPFLSENERFVVFHSLCSNVIPGLASNNHLQVFERDLVTGITILVSADLTNTTSANNDADVTDVSADGRFVLFSSLATNLVAGGAPASEYLVRDTLTNTTVPVVVDAKICNQPPSISGDGSVVLLNASNNLDAVPGHCSTFDVYAWNRSTGVSANISIGPRTGRWRRSHVEPAVISSDGRFVFFTSDEDALVAEDRNGTRDIFVRDLQTGILRMVSVSADGATSGNNSSSLRYHNWATLNHDNISPDGRFVAFASSATNLVSSPRELDSGVFVRDLVTNTTIAVPKALPVESKLAYAVDPRVTSDGRFVLFRSVTFDSPIHHHPTEVCLFDRQTGLTQVVSHAPPYPQYQSPGYEPLGMTSDGRYVAYGLALYTFGEIVSPIYVRDMQTGRLTTINTGGSGGLYDVGQFTSLTGRLLFSTYYSLVPSDSNDGRDAYLFDIASPDSTQDRSRLNLPPLTLR